MKNPKIERVLVTGGTGFVGGYIVGLLLENGYNVRVISRSHSEQGARSTNFGHYETVIGDILDSASLLKATEGCDAVIHLVGIIEESPRKGITFESVHVAGTENVVSAARSIGVRYFVHMSANGIAESARTAYQRTKWIAENLVRTAGFDTWTIFRPSLIFGKPSPGRTEFGSRIIETLIKPFPIWPIPGRGEYQLQPVAVEDVAKGFVTALGNQKHSGKTYCVGGPEKFAYVEILDILSRAIGKKPRPKFFQPIWGIRPVVSLLAPTGILPITPAQLELLIGGNTCDSSAFRDEFGLQLTPFGMETLAYLAD
ncbi:MAG: NAD-dependent epimerase/dehydratase family protein [Bacteroidetes bacterium]|nr:MAG: NAD-dependent epimerase/dehydratase family protein [Bacteroidota bacterium]